MEIDNNDIFHHDSDVDVTHKINTEELHNWISHLKYVKNEMLNLIELCKIEFHEKLADSSIVERFGKKKEENKIMLDALVKYNNSRTDIAECEDTQCDMAFISTHESYRKSYLYHIEKYRKLKDDFFNKVQGKFTGLN